MSVDSTPFGVEVKPISRSLRFEILRRDNHTCRYCGAKAPDVELQVDHVLPVALGGTNDPTNLTTACRDCNSGKGSTSPDAETVAQVDADAERWSEIMQRAAELERGERVDTADHVARVRYLWAEIVYYPSKLPHDTDMSILTFMKAGLDVEDMRYAIEQAAKAGKDWRYFCGICWNLIRRRQEIARELMG